MGGGGPKIETPTLGDVANFAVDALAAYYTYGYSLTEPGKKDLKGIKSGAQNIQENLTGQTARTAAADAAAQAKADQAKREAQMAEQSLLTESAKGYASARTRQKALAGEKTGRAGTILTGIKASTGNQLGVGTNTGKTLLGQ